MYSRIERHGDRQTTGDMQFEKIWRLGRHISSNCQSPVLCLSRANPAFGPAERNRGAPSCSPRAPDCWEHGPGCWGLALKFSGSASCRRPTRTGNLGELIPSKNCKTGKYCLQHTFGDERSSLVGGTLAKLQVAGEVDFAAHLLGDEQKYVRGKGR